MGKIRETDKWHIRELLKDPAIRAILAKENKLPEQVQIDDDGNITAYYGSGPQWWGRLTGDNKEFTFTDFAIRVAKVLGGTGKNKREIVLNGLVNTVINQAIGIENYQLVVDALFDAARYGGIDDCSLQSKFVNAHNPNVTIKRGVCELNSGEYAGPPIKIVFRQ
jgi:hypothetical protein